MLEERARWSRWGQRRECTVRIFPSFEPTIIDRLGNWRGLGESLEERGRGGGRKSKVEENGVLYHKP
jgi:hypothetical protein